MSTTLGSAAENIVENIPSNQQIEEGIETVRKEISAVRVSPGVDTTGQQILTDTEQVLSSAEQLLKEKNLGDKFQKILKEGQKATVELQRQAEILQAAGAPAIDTDRLKELAEKALETARLAGMELVSSNSFRRSLSDFLLLCYDILADVTTEAIQSESSKAKGKELLASKKKEPMIKPAAATETKTTTTTQTTAPTSTTRVAPSGNIPAPPPPPPSTTTTPPSSSAGEGESLKDQAKGGIESAITKGLEAAGAEQAVPKEKVKELVNRFMELMKIISQRERTKNVFLGLMDMFTFFGEQVASAPVKGEVGKTGETAVSKAQRSASALRYNKHVMKTLFLSRSLLEQFTGDQSLETLIYHLRKVDNTIRKDIETRDYFHDLRAYMTDLLNRPELFDDPETGRRGKKLIKRGRTLQDKKLWVHLRGILDETKNILHEITHDPATRRLRHDMKRLIEDIMLDEQGNIVLKENVLQQLRLMIVNSVVERMRLPVPTIRIEDEDMCYTLRNLIVSIRDLVPERVVMETRGRIALDLTNIRQPEVESASNTIRLVIQNINIHMEQADIAFHRKTFPRVTDRGKLRMDIGGKGMDLIIQLQTFAGARDFFRVEFVDCDVHSLNMYLQDTRHDWLYNSVLKFLSGRIKRGMESAIEDTLRNHLDQLNRMLLKQMRKTKGLKLGETTTEALTSAIKTGASVLTGGSFEE